MGEHDDDLHDDDLDTDDDLGASKSKRTFTKAQVQEAIQRRVGRLQSKVARLEADLETAEERAGRAETAAKEADKRAKEAEASLATEKERADKLQEDADKATNESKQAERSEKVKGLLKAAGIPEEWADTVTGDNDEELQGSIKALGDRLGIKPESGKPPVPPKEEAKPQGGLKGAIAEHYKAQQ